jgi:hypothetical protein
MDASSGGKKPKSAELIRDKLASVRASAERSKELGPHAAGLTATDRIAVETFVDPECAAAFQERLLDVGIHSERDRRQGRVGVLVDVEDRVRAAEILTAHLAVFPDRRRKRTRAYEATIALSLIGILSLVVTLPLIGFVDEANRVSSRSVLAALVVSVAIMVHLACAGLFFDLTRSRKLDLGRGQFNLIFVLWLTTAAALVVFWLTIGWW